MDKAIDLSQQATWPELIIAELNDSLAILEANEKSRRSVEELCEEDILKCLNPPELCYSRERTLLLQRIDSCLKDRCLLGFHCTRLHESEIEIVKAQGLQPLSEELAYGRIRRLLEIGALPSQVAFRLLSKNAVNNSHGRRLGRLCFMFSRSVLTSERAVSRFFSYWGGEALYWAHEDDPKIASVLKSIGRPCIVQAAVPVAILKTFTPVGEKLISVFLRTRGVATTDNGLLEGSLDQALVNDRIQRVIEYGEPEFDMLIHHAQWRCCLTSSD